MIRMRQKKKMRNGKRKTHRIKWWSQQTVISSLLFSGRCVFSLSFSGFILGRGSSIQPFHLLFTAFYLILVQTFYRVFIVIYSDLYAIHICFENILKWIHNKFYSLRFFPAVFVHRECQLVIGCSITEQHQKKQQQTHTLYQQMWKTKANAVVCFIFVAWTLLFFFCPIHGWCTLIWKYNFMQAADGFQPKNKSF